VSGVFEIGCKRTFAGAVDWPGWCRSGADKKGAVEALLRQTASYQKVLREAGVEFQAPEDVANLRVVEQLQGTAATDFGAPEAVLSSDTDPLDEAGLLRLHAIQRACWKAFDAAVEMAKGRAVEAEILKR
jgi:hypothetical protein